MTSEDHRSLIAEWKSQAKEKARIMRSEAATLLRQADKIDPPKTEQQS
jgi:hypothetical protein